MVENNPGRVNSGDSLGRVTASVVVSGIFTLAMIVAAIWAAIVLPASARIPLHIGSVERCYLVPKRAGLVIWPSAGVRVSGVLGGIAASGLAADWVPGVRYVLAPAAAGLLLAFAVGALAMARRDSAPPAVPEAKRERETSVRSE